MSNVSKHVYFQSLDALGLLLGCPVLINYSVGLSRWLFQVTAFL